MSGDEPKLMERLGGAESLVRIVDTMYQRVLSDPDLAPFFENVPMERLRKMQFQFLACAFDGPIEYSGRELTAAHSGRAIGQNEFSAFCGHFVASLEEHDVEKADIDQALGRLATYRDKVIGEANVDG